MRWSGERALLTTRTGVGLFIDGDGVPIGSPFTIVARSPNGSVDGGTLAFNGAAFLASFATTNPASVVVASVPANGATGQSAALYSSTRGGALAQSGVLASDGTRFLATYASSPPSCDLGGRCTPAEPYRRVVQLDAAFAPSLGPVLSDTGMGLTFANGSYLSYNRSNAQTLDANGNALTPVQPLLAAVSNGFYSALGRWDLTLVPERGGTGFLATSGPLATRVSSAFSPLDAPPLAPFVLPAAQLEPAATFDSENYIAAWFDEARGGLYAGRVSTDGSLLDAEPFEIESGSAHHPVLSSNGTDVLAAWSDGETTHAFAGAARFTPNGPKESVTVPTSPPYVSSLDLASDGTNYLALWGSPGLVFDPPDPVSHAALLSAGMFSNAIDFGQGDVSFDAVYDGENYVVVWGNRGSTGTRDVFGTRISRNLALVDATPRPLLNYPASPLFDVGPRISAGSDGLAVVWVESADPDNQRATVRLARLTSELEFVAGSSVVVGEQAPLNAGVRVAWDGSRYWVVWETTGSDSVLTLVGRRIAADGTPLDATPFEITTEPDPSFHPFGLVSGPVGELLLVYEKGGSSRVARGRLLSSPGGGTGGGGAGGDGGAAGEGATGGSSNGGSSTGGNTTGGVSGSAGADAGSGGEDAGAGGDSTGGTSGRGGSAGTGGAGRGGGAGAGDAGAGESGAGASGGGNGGDDGCSCSHASSDGKNALPFLVLALAGALRRRRARSPRLG
jgi:MYXO-CTERM domain-containing protein